MKRGLALPVVGLLLVLILLSLGGMALYTADMADCWAKAESGRLIGCGPRVPDWSWMLAAVTGVVLLGVILGRLRHPRRGRVERTF